MADNYITSFGSIELTVTPDKMYATASLLDKNISDAKKSFDRLISLINSTSSYWKGDAAEKERERFKGENENFAKLIVNLSNYSKELRAITSIYEMNEEAAAVSSGSLPANVIE